MTEVPSPCIGICTVDAHRVCIGCHRTLAEIAAWRSASASERSRMVESASRRAQMARQLETAASQPTADRRNRPAVES
ncbi:MAG: DUF1289 domain-containing protein [Planctomycetaceae bacterium]|nr:MAG: DUF1289 domain-containing protein [Planctomycetaceae bacterium]